jgi:hypothetical protein
MVRLVWFSIGQIESSVNFFPRPSISFRGTSASNGIYAESYGVIVEKISPTHLGKKKKASPPCQTHTYSYSYLGCVIERGYVEKWLEDTGILCRDVLRILLSLPTVSSPDMAEAFTVLVSVCYCSTGWVVDSWRLRSFTCWVGLPICHYSLFFYLLVFFRIFAEIRQTQMASVSIW